VRSIVTDHDAEVTQDVPADVAAATPAEKAVIARLLELYVHDLSTFTHADVGDDGLFGYPRLDSYWTEPERHPLLIRTEGRIAGFALVRSGTPHDMAEFFIMRRYRRTGLGISAARAVFARFPGAWQVRQLAENAPATAFWRAAIPVPFTETAVDGGPVQHFFVADPRP
jgi:predicted acetyltransferase